MMHDQPGCAEILRSLASLDREYSLYEIAIMTRAGPAKSLGLKLIVATWASGACADITVYDDNPNREAMFENARTRVQERRADRSRR
jgi:formylmethanofuran dehydrogenase subunit A